MENLSHIIVKIKLHEINQLQVLVPFLSDNQIELMSFEKAEYSSHVVPKNQPVSKKNFDLQSAYYEKVLGKKGMPILLHLVEGNSYLEIAEKTGNSIDGVRYYIKKIYKMFNVKNAREALKVYLAEKEKYMEILAS